MSLLLAGPILKTPAPPVVGGSITVVDGQSNPVAADGLDDVVVFNTAPIENDIVVVFQAYDDQSTQPGLPTGYTSEIAAGGDSGRRMSYKVMTSTPDTSVTIPGNASFKQGCLVLVLRGVDTATPIDVTDVTNNGAGTTLSFSQITTVTDDALVMAWGVLDDDATTVSSYPSGYTDQYEGNSGGGGSDVTMFVASTTKATAGAETPGSAVMNSDDNWRTHTIAWRPA